MTEQIKYIPARLKSAVKGGHVTGAEDIDAGDGKNQQQVNNEVDDTLALHQSEINGLSSQNYVTVETYASLPATGEADTIYRVSSYDGTQIDATKYAEYAWNGSAYVLLDVKTQVGEVFDISQYKAIGGTLAKFDDLAAALDGGDNVPVGVRKGGMSVKYVQTSDNKYVQYRLMTNSWSINPDDWMNIEEINYVKNEIDYISSKEHSGFMYSNGTFANLPNFHCLYTDKIPCKEGDTFMYKGVGSSDAYSVILRNDNTIVDSLQINSSVAFAEVIIPSGVNNVQFSSFAPISNDVVFAIYKNNSVFGTTIAQNKEIDRINTSLFDDFSLIKEISGFIGSSGSIISNNNYHSLITSNIPCAEGDVFMYKGDAAGDAVAVILRNGNEIVSVAAKHSNYKYSEITIPNGVDSVQFQSIAPVNNDIIFDVINTKGTSVLDRIYRDENKISSYIETKQRGYLTPNGTYADTSHFYSITRIYECKAGDTFKYYGIGDNNACEAILINNNEIVHTWSGDNRNTPLEITLNTTCDKIIFSSFNPSSGGYDGVVLNVEKENDTTLQGQVDVIKNTIEKIEEVQNVLYGKKWVACGDSFTHGDFTGYIDDQGHTGTQSDAYDPAMGMYKTYPWWIGKRNSMTIVNEAENGSTLARCWTDSETLAPENYNHPFSYQRYLNIANDADYITLWFGINDSAYTKLGTINDEDNTTFYGAWNVVLPYLIEHHPYAKIGVIITNAIPESRSHWLPAFKNVCQKWGIPYLDLQEDYEVPLVLDVIGKPLIKQSVKTARNNSFYVTSTNHHPNLKAHEYQSTFIENWLRSL